MFSPKMFETAAKNNRFIKKYSNKKALIQKRKSQNWAHLPMATATRPRMPPSSCDWLPSGYTFDLWFLCGRVADSTQQECSSQTDGQRT